MLTRLCIVLLLTVVVSALHLVHMQYQWRRLTSTLNAEEIAGNKLQDEQRALLSQVRSLTTAAQVEQVAREKLHMQESNSRVTLSVAQDAQGLAVSGRVALPASAKTGL